MVPASPPLPTVCSLPFQPASGSQTSKLIAEEGVGVITPCTWQKAGKPAKGLAPPVRASGRMNAPAGTDLATVMVVSDIFRPDKASQSAHRDGRQREKKTSRLRTMVL